MTEILSAQHALAIVEHCPIALLIMDADDRVAGFNRAFAQLVGHSRATELQGHAAADLGDHPAAGLLAAASPLCWTDRNGSRHHFEVRRIDLPGGESRQARLFIDITRQVELERARDALDEELRQHSLTDPVTGLLNQRGVALALEPQVARSRRYNSPITVIMMDLQCDSDCDKVYLHAARLLRDQLRWADLIGCTEQHAFMLILPETTAEAGLRLAGKLQQRLRDMADREFGGRPLDACYGLTEWRRSDSADTLLKRAGEALSRARRDHRNQPVAL